jgi:hypothetical protein
MLIVELLELLGDPVEEVDEPPALWLGSLVLLLRVLHEASTAQATPSASDVIAAFLTRGIGASSGPAIDMDGRGASSHLCTYIV